MTKKEYHEYLQTDAWKETREAILTRDDGKCRLCNSSEHLNVHHRSYANVGRELSKPTDLITLCRKCHEIHHGVMVKPEVAKKIHKQRAVYIPKAYSFELTQELLKGLQTDKGGFTSATLKVIQQHDINTRQKGWAKQFVGTIVTRAWYVQAVESRSVFSASTKL